MISLSMDVQGIFSYLLRAGSATVGQMLIFMGPGLILVVIMSLLARQVQSLAARSLGIPLYLGLFGWLGTSIHEIGHAIFHTLFGHHIVEFRPYKPDPSGTLGYVRFTYNQNSLYQQIGMFFAAIGPILFGTLFIFIASLLLIEPNILDFIRSIGINRDSLSISSGFTGLLNDILSYSLSVVGFLFQPAHFVDWRFYLFAYIAFAVGSSLSLSKPDIKNARYGLTTLVIFWFLVNVAVLWSGDLSSASFGFMSQFYIFFYAIMIFALVLNLIAAAVLFPFAAMRGSAQT